MGEHQRYISTSRLYLAGPPAKKSFWTSTFAREPNRCDTLHLHCLVVLSLSQHSKFTNNMDTNMAGTSAFEPEMAQVKVTFTTTEDGFELAESRRQLLVPAGTSVQHELRFSCRSWQQI